MTEREELLRLIGAAQGAVRACALKYKGGKGPAAIVDVAECVAAEVPRAVEEARKEATPA